MALFNKLCKYRGVKLQNILALRNVQYLTLREKTMTVDIDIDALDDFTTQLIQKKSDKWGKTSLKIRKKLFFEAKKEFVEDDTFEFNIQQLNAKEIDSLFQEVLDENDKNKLVSLVNECIKWKTSPGPSVLIGTLSVLSQNGDIASVKNIETFCQVAHPDFVKLNSNFNLYLAQAVWVRGNALKAIGIFEDVYRNNPFLRRRLRLMLRYLIYDAVYNRSEAVLLSILNFTEGLVTEYNDFFLLMTLWQICFLSEWFTDQCLALELLEHYDGLRKAVVGQIPLVVTTSLKYHKTEPVYRLLEILLKYSMKEQYSIVLIALFEYRFRQGDLLSCFEIYHWSARYGITMPSISDVKFLELLTKHNVPVKKEENVARPTIQLKF